MMKTLSSIKKTWWYRLWKTVTNGLTILLSIVAIVVLFLSGIFGAIGLFDSNFVLGSYIVPVLVAFAGPLIFWSGSFLLFDRLVYIIFGQLKKDTVILSPKWKKVIILYAGFLIGLLLISLAWVHVDGKKSERSIYYSSINLNEFSRELPKEFEGNAVNPFIELPGTLYCSSDESDLQYYNENALKESYCHPDAVNKKQEYIDFVAYNNPEDATWLLGEEFSEMVDQALIHTDDGLPRVCFIRGECSSHDLVKLRPNLIYYFILFISFILPLFLAQYLSSYIKKG